MATNLFDDANVMLDEAGAALDELNRLVMSLPSQTLAKDCLLPRVTLAKTAAHQYIEDAREHLLEAEQVQRRLLERAPTSDEQSATNQAVSEVEAWSWEIKDKLTTQEYRDLMAILSKHHK